MMSSQNVEVQIQKEVIFLPANYGQKIMKRGHKMPKTTKNYHRIPVGSKGPGAKIRTISIGKGIKALYDAKNKKIITYLFDVKKYTMKEAREWVKKHKSSSAVLQIVENLSLVEGISELYIESKKETINTLK